MHLHVNEEAAHMAVPIRNEGNGIGLLQGWFPYDSVPLGSTPPPPVDRFRPQTRALYVPAGGIGYWQGALRGEQLDEHKGMLKAIDNRDAFSVDLLYTDREGGQPIISRFTVYPTSVEDAWLATVGRHWELRARREAQFSQRARVLKVEVARGAVTE